MKYTYRTGIKKIKRNIAYSVSTLVLAGSSIAGGLPLLLSQKAMAATHSVCASSCSTYADIQSAIDSAADGDTISLDGNATIDHQLTITKSLTINGNGHTISPHFTKVDNDNNASIGIIAATGPVSISNLVIDGTSGTTLHGINAFKSTVSLDGVALKNNDRDGLVVNSSDVTVNNIATSGNGWGGIDVDQNSNSSSRPAVLTVNGTSLHTEAVAAIVVDNVTHLVTVNDTNSQYSIAAIGNTRLYTLNPVIAACTTTNSVESTDLSSWNLSETRSAGSNQLVPGGLHVTTIPSNGSYPNEFSKAAGYYTTDFALKDAGTPGITIAPGFTGTRPSLQLGVDKDGNGSWDGYLVYEPWSYGTGNFWSSKDFGINSGMGYTSFGTLNQYLAANPNARVTSIGYSLGSGVTGDAVITKLTAGCTDYTFDVAPLTAPANGLPNNSYETTNDFYFTWDAVTGGTTPYTYEFQSSLNPASTGGVLTTGLWHSGTLTSPTIHSTGAPDGTWYWQVRATDANGTVSSWSPIWKVTIDTHAPVVAITAPHDGDTVHGTVTVSGTVTDTNPDHYYFVVKDSHGTVKAGPGTVNAATVSSWSWNTKNVSDGVYTIDLEARDAAGNKTSVSVATIHVTVDNTAPTATIDAYNGTDTTPTLTGTVSDPTASLTVKIDNSTPAAAHNNGDGTWSFTVPTALSAGTHTIVLTATDTAGNPPYQTTANVTVVAPNASQTGIDHSQGNGNSDQATGHQATVTVTPNNDGQVLGDSTTTTGEVKGDSTVKPATVHFANDTALRKDTDTKNASASFLGLGWWWIAVLAALVGFFLFLFRRPSSNNS